MKKLTLSFIFSFASLIAQGQLSVEKIMQDPAKWIGTSPNNIFWSEDSKTIYFSWNPDKNKSDSLYKVSILDKKPIKVLPQERRTLSPANGVYNKTFSQKVYEKNGDIFLVNCQIKNDKSMIIRQLTNTVEREANPYFSGDGQKIIFIKANNLFSLNLDDGFISQLTNFMSGSKKTEGKATEQEKWLKNDQLALFEVLKERKNKKEEAEKNAKSDLPKRPKEIYLEDKTLESSFISPDLRFVSYQIAAAPKTSKTTIVPNYVTESGFTEDITGRTKVGNPLTSYESFIYDTKKDTIYPIITKDISGLSEKATFTKDYKTKQFNPKDSTTRKLFISSPIWSEDAKNAVLNVRSLDNKDRWIMLLNAENGHLKLLDRQHDEAWIGGPGIGNTTILAWLDEHTIYFQSEADGYSHLYSMNVISGEKKQLASGKFEVQQVQLSRDKKTFYLTTNEVHPGETHFYKMAVSGGERTKITTMIGANEVSISPDETNFAIRYSYINKPWELYLASTTSKAEQITHSTTAEFNSYPWKDAKIITFKAQDGASVYARLYEPLTTIKNQKAIIFVHGAGYLQNAHKWWSQYYREYMFHNLLVDKGYTVLDIDYRGSSGYGRDWRTGIYRFMGGKDLTDQTDGAKYLIDNQGISPNKIGIYGGSYGGFITLMAMFTTPDVFAAGAALRPVTDWASYNHGYTSNILNEPFTDSLAYRKSSPIYYADGLKGHLLICHGLVDLNVHIQDSFRLSQRLMELKKDNWELAVYPVEDHGFVQPSSWTDEYKRILKLFEENLK